MAASRVTPRWNSALRRAATWEAIITITAGVAAFRGLRRAGRGLLLPRGLWGRASSRVGLCRPHCHRRF